MTYALPPTAITTPTDPLACFGPIVAPRMGPLAEDRPYELFSVEPATPIAIT